MKKIFLLVLPVAFLGAACSSAPPPENSVVLSNCSVKEGRVTVQASVKNTEKENRNFDLVVSVEDASGLRIGEVDRRINALQSGKVTVVQLEGPVNYNGRPSFFTCKLANVARS